MIPKDLPKHLCTQSQFAQKLGITQQRISQAIKEGKIGGKAVEMFKGRAYINDAEARRQWAISYTGQGNSSPALAARLDSEFETEETAGLPASEKLALEAKNARDQKAIWDAKIARQKYENTANILVDKASVSKALFEFGREFRDKLMAIPARTIDYVRAAKTRHEAEKVLADAIHAAILDIVNLDTRLQNKIANE